MSLWSVRLLQTQKGYINYSTVYLLLAIKKLKEIFKMETKNHNDAATLATEIIAELNKALIKEQKENEELRKQIEEYKVMLQR